MNPATTVSSGLSPAARAVLLRLIGIYGTLLLLVCALASDYVAMLTGREVLYPSTFNTLPLLAPGLLLGVFFFFRKKDCTEDHIRRPSQVQLAIGAGVLLIAVVIAYFATHPTDAQFAAMQKFLVQKPVTGGTIVTALLRTSLALPFPALFFLFFPASFLRRFRWSIGTLCIALFAFLLAGIPDILFYASTIPFLLEQTAVVLSIFTDTVSIDAATRMLQVREFSAAVGPACAGFSLLVLFLGFAALQWLRLKEYPAFSPLRMGIITILGVMILFVLNVLRIALLMIIGTFLPSLSLALFHGTAGLILLLLACAALLRLAETRKR